MIINSRNAMDNQQNHEPFFQCSEYPNQLKPIFWGFLMQNTFLFVITLLKKKKYKIKPLTTLIASGLVFEGSDRKDE